MGWYFDPKGTTREQLIERLVAVGGQRGRILAFKEVGSVLWRLGEADDLPNGPVILCDLLEASDDSWGHKPLDESMHPFYYDCPLSFLKRAPVVNQAWRLKVFSYHRRLNHKYQVGDVIVFSGLSIPCVKVIWVKPLTGEHQGRLYKLPRKLLVNHVVEINPQGDQRSVA